MQLLLTVRVSISNSKQVTQYLVMGSSKALCLKVLCTVAIVYTYAQVASEFELIIKHTCIASCDNIMCSTHCHAEQTLGQSLWRQCAHQTVLEYGGK